MALVHTSVHKFGVKVLMLSCHSLEHVTTGAGRLNPAPQSLRPHGVTGISPPRPTSRGTFSSDALLPGHTHPRSQQATKCPGWPLAQKSPLQMSRPSAEHGLQGGGKAKPRGSGRGRAWETSLGGLRGAVGAEVISAPMEGAAAH